MKNRKTKREIYFKREVREIFERTRAFGILTIYTFISHISGKHRTILTLGQAENALRGYQTEINRGNGTNRSAAIPIREDRTHKMLATGETGGRFCGLRRIPPTPEGRAILFAYRQGRTDELNKLIRTQVEIIEADKKKGILTGGQVDKLKESMGDVVQLPK